jgi:hypothetical protein
MDRFSFFFAFYGLLLGLAVAELLGGFARMVRAKAVRKIEAQTALIALLTFLLICATWIDAFGQFTNVSLDFAGLWAPILTGTAYYLVATVIFPTDEREFDRLANYFADRKRFMVAMLLAAETFVNVTSLQFYTTAFNERPASFWLVIVPFNLMINAIFVALLLVRSRRLNIILLAAQIILFVLVYWSRGALVALAHENYGYLWTR